MVWEMPRRMNVHGAHSEETVRRHKINPSHACDDNKEEIEKDRREETVNYTCREG